MNQISKLISALSARQRITIVAAVLLVIGGISYLSHWRTESDFRPVYTSLAPEDAAAVVQKLKESGVQYRLSEDGASVLAPSARVAELRLEMAAAGLPKSGRIGFELFDKNNLGVTEFAEHVNYSRALEGELERSITSLTEIQQARVHLTFPKDSVFLDSKQAAKASVVVHLRPGAKLSAQNINAIANLVASAVEGLAPESIAIVDSRGALLNRPRKASADDAAQPSEASLEYRQKIESDLLAKINATLEPLLGSDKFRAGVSVDCDFTSGEQSEETLDPNKSVMLTSQKTEESTGSALSAGVPGTATNLPRPPKTTGGSNGVNRKTENIAFQTSRVVRHTRTPQGSVKRISVSVLIDNELKWEGPAQKQRRVLVVPTAERLKSIRDVITGVAGLSTERGDQLVVESQPFEATLSAEPPPSAPTAPGPDPRFPKWMLPLVSDPKNMIIAIAAAVAFPILLVVVMMLLRKKTKKVSAEAPQAIAGAAGHQAAVDGAAPGEQAAIEEPEAPPFQFKLPKETTKKSEFLIKHIRENIQKDNTSMVNVLRTWLADNSASENME